jgi:DNA invertase Pin-like site-specific DNA recombinase
MPDNSGENCGTHILKKTEVEVIKKLIDAGEAIKNIAIRFKVSPYTIYDIKNKRTWKSLSEACYE